MLKTCQVLLSAIWQSLRTYRPSQQADGKSSPARRAFVQYVHSMQGNKHFLQPRQLKTLSLKILCCRFPIQENPTSLSAAVDNFSEDSREASGEVHEEVFSPGSRPIQRKPRIQKKVEVPQSELGKSLNEDDDFVPPHILSLPAQNFNALELSSRPVSVTS